MSGLLTNGRILLPLAALGSAALAGTLEGPATPFEATSLKACATISAPTERLACYDHIARSEPAPAAASGAAAAPPPAAPAPSTSPPKKSFGLYGPEHPAPPPPIAALTAKVIALGVSASGHPTVELDGGQLWELDGAADPVLAKGDSVTIKRAALGSFLMTTPGRRTHRVHRLR